MKWVDRGTVTPMDASYISALAALAGSAVGALSSFATTWLTQNAKYRSDQRDKTSERRERLYGAFIDEASQTFVDALIHQIQDPTQLVKVYSIISRMRLFAPGEIVVQAESVMETIVLTYKAPNRTIEEMQDEPFERMDLLRKFSEACRDDIA